MHQKSIAKTAPTFVSAPSSIYIPCLRNTIDPSTARHALSGTQLVHSCFQSLCRTRCTFRPLASRGQTQQARLASCTPAYTLFSPSPHNSTSSAGSAPPLVVISSCYAVRQDRGRVQCCVRSIAFPRTAAAVGRIYADTLPGVFAVGSGAPADAADSRCSSAAGCRSAGRALWLLAMPCMDTCVPSLLLLLLANRSW
jgi:hypothetical protein